MKAREILQTLEDHHFTGNALEDFGLSDEDTQVSGLREMAEDALSVMTFHTEASTVKMANLKPPPPSANSYASVTGGTVVSSLEDEESKSQVTDVLSMRMLVIIGLIILSMPSIGVALVWILFPSSTHNDQRPNNIMGTNFFPPTSSPSPTSLLYTPPHQPTDMFYDRGVPTLHCRQPIQPAPPLYGKKGIVLSHDEYNRVHIGKILDLDPYWNYSRGSRPARNQPDQLEFIPMIENANDFEKTAQEIVDLHVSQSNFHHLMGYFEPDAAYPEASSMTVDAALHRWQLLQELQMPLISPSARDATGAWMREFMQRADEKCFRIDWIGVHWYGDKSFHNFKTNMELIYSMFGQRPLLITEFATVDSKAQERGFNSFDEADVLEFMKQAIPWLEEQEWIAGYAWHNFPANHTTGGPAALFDSKGSLTTVGKYYASVRTDKPEGNQSISV